MASSAAAGSVEIVDPGQGTFPVEVGDTGATQLSGLAHASGRSFYAVSDSSGRLYPLEIEIDPASGWLRSAVAGRPVRLRGATDLEGVAYHAERASVLVADEAGPYIREYRASDGELLGEVAVPEVYRQGRRNLNLESLSRSGTPASLWTVNEEALRVDGPRSTRERGSVVRLQRFDAGGRPNGQWAYRTEPVPGETDAKMFRSGVPDLVVLPTGELLVMERSFSDQGFAASIFVVELEGASEVSALERLEGARYVPVRKRLLWQTTRPLAVNLEGMALGPELAPGEHSLLLISDDGGLLVPTLWVLRVRPAAD